MNFELTHARHDPAHCLAPGLFRSLKRGERKRLKLDVTHQHGDDSLRFMGFEPLDAGDLRLLQGLVALAGPNGIILSPDPKTQVGCQLRLLLDPQFDAAERDARVVKSTVRHLLRETGMTGSGSNIKAVIASLTRMAGVTVAIKRGSRLAIFHLLSFAFDAEDGRLLVALNHRVTEAVLGERSYTHIPMSEVRALESDPARLIHQRLCGWIDPGKSGKAEIGTLIRYVWPDEASNEAMKKRRQAVRKAIAELVAIGWMLNEYSGGKWLIKRPALCAS